MFENSKYKISLITPVYNAVASLPNAFESVKSQTIGFENIEYILIDDCSTDGSGDLVDRYASNHQNVVSLHTERNSGTAGTPRNLGLDNASAPYVMFLDNDDRLTPQACEVLFCKIEMGGTDIVSGDCREAHHKDRASKHFSNAIYSTAQYAEGIYEISELNQNVHRAFFYNFWTKIYKRSIITEYDIRFTDGILWEDLYFLFLYLTVCERGEIVHEDILIYTSREESLSHQNNEFFYRTIPQSIMRGVHHAEEMGRGAKYIQLLEHAFVVEYYIDLLMQEQSLDEDTLSKVFLEWRELFALVYSVKMEVHSTYAKILTRDMAECNDERVLYDFFVLRDLYGQRKRELDDIFSSNTWKLAKLANKLFGKKR